MIEYNLSVLWYKIISVYYLRFLIIGSYTFSLYTQKREKKIVAYHFSTVSNSITILISLFCCFVHTNQIFSHIFIIDFLIKKQVDTIFYCN